MAKRPYKKRSGPRVPPQVDGVDFNRCYVAHCDNFGRYPAYDTPKWGRQDTAYTLDNKGSQLRGSFPALDCRSCGSAIRMVSNQAAVDEETRYWPPVVDPCACRNPDCTYCGHSVAAYPEEYQRFGTTSGGAQRYRCRGCRRTFSVNANPYRRLRLASKTEDNLRLLVNKVPMRRLCEVADINAPVLYQRIGLLYERLRTYARSKEESFLRDAHFERLRVEVDRQDHVLAWGSSIDRQAFVLKSTATADTWTGYILAQHVNYDPGENAMQRELESRALGDPEKPAAFRRFARLWLPHEARTNRQIKNTGQDTQARAPDEVAVALAGRGAFVHENYAMMGHFLFLSV